MLSRSTRQSSTVMASGWFGARTVKRDLPPNRREMDDPSNTNSSKKLTVTSTSGVVRPPVSGPPAPRCPLRSPSSLNRFQNGGGRTSGCNTAFAKYIPPVFTSPRRARRRGSVALPVGRDGVALARTAKAFSLDKGGTWDSGPGETAGAKKLAVDEAGGKGSEAGVAPAATV